SGETCSAVFLAADETCRLLGTTDQQFGAPDLPEEPFLYTGSSGPRRLNPGEVGQLSLLGESLTRRFGLRGLFNVDYVFRGSGIWPLEVNPRYSASVEVLECALGQNFLTLHAAEF